MPQTQDTAKNLQEHLRILTVSIGERSVFLPQNLRKTQDYIESFYRGLGLDVRLEQYRYENITPTNVAARMAFTGNPAHRFILGAHYDSVGGTVGADDNASGIAVQLEVARQLKALQGTVDLDLSVEFVSFALEEPPAFSTQHMGSRVHAKRLKEEGVSVDGMICLEMVGYACREPGCQGYPFPLKFMNYPKTGDFIGIVGNFGSRGLTRSLEQAFRKNPDLPVISLNVPFNGWIVPPVRLSDHSSFWDEGYRAVMVTDSAFYRNPHYHLPSDTMDKLDYQYMAELVKSLVIFFSSFPK